MAESQQKYVAEICYKTHIAFFLRNRMENYKKVPKTFGLRLEDSLYLQPKKRVNSFIVWRIFNAYYIITNHLV